MMEQYSKVLLKVLHHVRCLYLELTASMTQTGPRKLQIKPLSRLIQQLFRGKHVKNTC